MLGVFQACFEIDHTHAAKSTAIVRLKEYCPKHVLYGGRRQVVNNVSDTHNSAELRQEAEEVEFWRGNFEQPVWEDGLCYFLEDMVRHVGVQRPSQTGEIVMQSTVRGGRGNEYGQVSTLDFSNAIVVEARCDCPNDAAHGKHMVAAIIALVFEEVHKEEALHVARQPSESHARNDYRAPDYNTASLPDSPCSVDSAGNERDTQSVQTAIKRTTKRAQSTRKGRANTGSRSKRARVADW